MIVLSYRHTHPSGDVVLERDKLQNVHEKFLVRIGRMGVDVKLKLAVLNAGPNDLSAG